MVVHWFVSIEFFRVLAVAWHLRLESLVTWLVWFGGQANKNIEGVWEPTWFTAPMQIENLLGKHGLEPTHQFTHSPQGTHSKHWSSSAGPTAHTACIAPTLSSSQPYMPTRMNDHMLNIYKHKMILAFHVSEVASPHATATTRYRITTLSRTRTRSITIITCTDIFLLMT